MRLIDADALKESMRGEFFDSVEEWTAIRKIDEAPTIEPKHGEWVISYADDYGIKKTECSACGASFITYDVYDWKYCPWCGASMREREGE